MSEAPPTSDRVATPLEQAHLETAHHEICSALTILQSNVELVRVQLRHEPDPSLHVTVQGHLSELDLAVERLKRLALQMRTWHAGDPGASSEGDAEIRGRPNTSILP